MKNKMTLFSLIIFFSLGFFNFANASSSISVCDIKGKIINTSEKYIYITVTNVDIIQKDSSVCSNIKVNKNYKFDNEIFFRNSYRGTFIPGQNLVIDGTSWNAMGPNGVVSGNGWELHSAGDKTINIPINNLDLMDSSVLTELVEGQTYTFDQLKNTISPSVVTVKTKGFVSKINWCDSRSDTICPQNLYLVENMSDDYKDGITISFGFSEYDKVKPLKIGQKYEFFLKHYINGWINAYQLVSFRDVSSTPDKASIKKIETVDNKPVVTPNPVVVNAQPVKQSFISRFISWFFGIFRK